MNAADRSIKRIHEITRNMNALVPHALSKPAERMPSAHELLKRERELSGMRSSQAVIVEPDAEEPMPLVEHVIVWLGIVITAGLLVMLTVERIAS